MRDIGERFPTITNAVEIQDSSSLLKESPLLALQAEAFDSPSLNQLVEESKECSRCKEVKPLSAFDFTGDSKFRPKYRRNSCKECRKVKDKTRRTSDLGRQKLREARRGNRSSYLLADSRQSDRRGRRAGNDLDKEFIESFLRQPCSYCGDRLIMMTLDRIDNSKAHTKVNVVHCCIRCNYLKSSMPHEAWMHLVPSVRSASVLGLFGSWRSEPLNRKKE